MGKNYEVLVSELTKKEKVEMNKLFTMRFEISNIGPNWTHEHIEVIDSEQQKGKRVSALKSG